MNSLHKYNAHQRYAQISEMEKKPINNPLVGYYNAIEKTQAIPRGMGFVNKRRNINEIDVSNQNMGSQYVDAFTEGIKALKYVTDLNLKDTNLDT